MQINPEVETEARTDFQIGQAVGSEAPSDLQIGPKVVREAMALRRRAAIPLPTDKSTENATPVPALVVGLPPLVP